MPKNAKEPDEFPADSVSLDTSKDELVALIVKDDGAGTPSTAPERFRGGQAGGIGLAGMRERLAELNGDLEVESCASGTTIRATVPTNACDMPGNNSELTVQNNA